MYKTFKSILLTILLKIMGSSVNVSIMRFIRNALQSISIEKRQSLVQSSTGIPLWLIRLILNFVTYPIGDERKWIHEIRQSTWRGAWIAPNFETLQQVEDAALNQHDLIIFYAHGGAYCLGHAKMYMETFQLMINHLQNQHNIRASILSLEYSLAPENVWPKARDEALDAYRYLTETIGIPSSKIIFAGDSAGGNLAATLLLTIKDQEQLRQPAGAALLSPWVDLTIDQPDFTKYRNDILSPKHIATFVPYFIPNYENLDEESRLKLIRNPLISPLYGNFSDTCPIFLSYGDKELFRTGIEHLKLNLERDGVNLTTLKGDDALHVWLVYNLMASSKAVYERDCKKLIDWMAATCKK